MELLTKKQMKRISDGLEKLGVAGIALGIFQGSWLGLFQGLVFFAVSVTLTEEE